MRFQVISLGAALLIGSPLLAASLGVSQIFAFGDSLSDNGNAFLATGGAAPGPNYATNPNGFGYFTDGTNTTPATTGPLGLWVDQFASKIGVSDPLPFLAPGGTGTNFAVASGETGTTSQQDMLSVLNTYFLPKYGGKAPSNALYTLWGGANDINHALVANPTNPTLVLAAGKTAADNIENEIITLHANGGQYFLWLNLPALGETPAARSFGAAAETVADAASQAFNVEYALDVQTLRAQGINVITVDINTLFAELLLNPSAFGFADIQDGCINAAPYVSAHPCSSTTNPNTYLFWDDEHPTTAGDALIAQVAFNAFQAAASQAVPEPATYALLFLGGCGLVAFRQTRRKPVRRV
jgi:outer membrane lipase/esterase